jgi:hypothetical protein
MSGPAKSRRLVGWQSIARYCDVDERTVRRWEADERCSFPVKNNPLDPNTVVADTDDIEAWRAKRAALPSRRKPRAAAAA